MRSKNVDVKGRANSSADEAEELNTLSYLCRKFPEKALDNIPLVYIKEYWKERWNIQEVASCGENT